MRALAFWKTVIAERTNFLQSLISLLAEHQVRYCVAGGQAVNAYAEPLVSLDLDLVVAAEQIEMAESVWKDHFTVERFPHSINVPAPGLPLRRSKL